MVSKCTNPNCPAEFLYFGDGKLFEFESTSSRLSKDFHWLCGECAKASRLKRTDDGEIVLVPLSGNQNEFAA